MSRSKAFNSRPWEFTAKGVAYEINGDHGSVGRVATEVVAELRSRGIRVSYSRSPKPCRFVFSYVEDRKNAKNGAKATHSGASSVLAFRTLALCRFRDASSAT